MTVDESSHVVQQLGEVLPDGATDAADERPAASTGCHATERMKNGITVKRLQWRLERERAARP